jgi:hypothetical protein
MVVVPHQQLRVVGAGVPLVERVERAVDWILVEEGASSMSWSVV